MRFVAIATLVCAAGCASTQPGARMMFDDFNVRSTAELASHGWIMRTAPGFPGIPDAVWGPDTFSINDGVVRMTSSTNRTATRQTQLCHQRKYTNGTFAARVRLAAGTAAFPDGDEFVQSFYLIAPSNGPMDPDYGEVDFEYLANGGWGTFQPTMFTTTWGTFQLEPWVADNSSTKKTGTMTGWHTFVAQVDQGTVRYFIDGRQFSGHMREPFKRPMSINFNLWFVKDRLSQSTDIRSYDEDIDWVYFKEGQIAPDQVERDVSQLRGRFVDTVPSLGLDSPCNF